MIRLIPTLMVSLIFSAGVFGQTNKADAPKLAVLVPPDAGLAVIVSQPECPLRIEDAYLLAYFTGGPGATYRLRNVGRKTIVAYTIAAWYSNNSGTVVEWRATKAERPLLPGRFQKTAADVQIIPLTDELRLRLDLRPPLRTIRFFVVVEVTFSDGTKYDARSAFMSLQTHLENFRPIYEKLNQ